MAMGKYSRVDGRKSTSQCSTVTLVVFVAFCLVGAWMLMSSSVVQVQNSDLSTKENAETNGDDSVSVEESSVKDVKDVSKDEQNEAPEKESFDDKTESQEEPKDEPKTEPDPDSDESKEKVDAGETGGDGDKKVQTESEESSNENKTESDDSEKKTDSSESGDGETQGDDKSNQPEENQEEKPEQTDSDKNTENQEKDQPSNEILPAAAQAEILKESTTESKDWSTQAQESRNEKKSQQSKNQDGYSWKLCNTTAGTDYIPCLDNIKAIKKLPDVHHYQHRERHCPEEAPTCLVPMPEGYRKSIKWPTSRDKIWYYNVPHTKLAEVKGHQNWVKLTGEYLTFPGGGTQFIKGALHYIDNIKKSFPDIAWGDRTRVILDVGCGVASFGGFLFERDVLALSFAPKDEHEAQVQFALERNIPAISSVMGTKRLLFPSSVFDAIHCARCRVPWHIEGGKLLLELNRVLRPGGYFVWSATPVYRTDEESVGIWKAMSELTKAMCWKLVSINKDELNQVGAAIFQKPTTNKCYNERPESEPPICEESDDPNAAWNVDLQACMHKVTEDKTKRGARWPERWPKRLDTAPYWLNSMDGVYGKSAPEDFASDYKHWKNVVSKSYLTGMGIDWSSVRNVMDMRAVYGGFAAALKGLNVWVMNIVPIESPDTLPIIYERGLFGMYHNWCESFNTYPRSYDLLHADHLFASLKKRCGLVSVMAEVDRVLRPEGKLIVRDDIETINEIEKMAKSLNWNIRMIYSKDKEGILCVQKTFWRPTETTTIQSAIA